ncbi:Serine/threonine-protein kinase ATR, partial [Trichinella pseudospiralis]
LKVAFVEDSCTMDEKMEQEDKDDIEVFGEHLNRLLSIYNVEGQKVNRSHTYHLCYLLHFELLPSRVLKDIQNTGDGSYYKTEMRFFTKLIRERPAVLTNYSKDAEVATTFYSWTLMKTLGVFSVDGSIALKEEIMEMARIIFNALGQRYSVSVMERLIVEFCKIQYIRSQALNKAETKMIYTFQLGLRSMEVESVGEQYPTFYMTDLEFEIADNDQCEIFQCFFCDFITQRESILINVQSDWLECFLITILDQFEDGDFELKERSLTCLLNIICNEKTVFPPHLGPFFIDHCFAFIEWLAEYWPNSFVNAEHVCTLLVEVLKFCTAFVNGHQRPVGCSILFQKITSKMLTQFCERLKRIIVNANFASFDAKLRICLLEMFTYCLSNLRLFPTVDEETASRLGSCFEATLDSLISRTLMTEPLEMLLSHLFYFCNYVWTSESTSCFIFEYYRKMLNEIAKGFAEPATVIEALSVCNFLLRVLFHVDEEQMSSKFRQALDKFKSEICDQLFSMQDGFAVVVPNLSGLNPDIAASMFQLLIDTIALILLTFVNKMKIHHVTFATALLSLPWIDTEDLLDSKCEDVEQFLSMKLIISRLDLCAIVQKCLHSLSIMPSMFCPLWRSYIFKSCIMSGKSEYFLYSLKRLPTLLHHFSLDHRQQYFTELQNLTCSNHFCGDDRTKVIGAFSECICIMANACHMNYDDDKEQKAKCRCCSGEFLKIDHDNFAKYPPTFCPTTFMFDRISEAKLASEYLSLLDLVRVVLVHCNLTENEIFEIYQKTCFLMDFEDLSVRKKYSICIGLMTALIDNDEFVELIKSALSRVQTGEFEHSSQSLLYYLGETAKYAREALYEHAIVRFTIFTLAQVGGDSLLALAAETLKDVGRIRGTTPKRLHVRFGCPIGRHLVRLCCDLLRESHGERATSDEVGSILRNAAVLFDYGARQVAQFVQSSVRHLVPWLMIERSNEASRAHVAVAKLLGTNRHCLLACNFRHVVLTITLNELPNDQVERVFEFIEREGSVEPTGRKRGSSSAGRAGGQRWTVATYLSWDLYSCVNELLLHLSLNVQRVLRMLLTIVHNFGRPPDVSASAVEAEVIGFIKPRILGVLIKFEEKFRSGDPVRDKIVALNSLDCLILMCGGQILDQAKLKVLSTLRSALAVQDVQFRQLCSRAWYTFFTHLRDDALKDILLSAVLAMLPLFEFQEQEQQQEEQQQQQQKSTDYNESILNFLFEQRVALIGDELDALAFLLLEGEQQCRAPAALLRRLRRPDACADWPLETALARCSSLLLGSESADIRRRCLLSLSGVLRRRDVELARRLAGADVVDSTVARLHAALICCVRAGDESVRLLAAAALGQLGALDPGRLPTLERCQDADEPRPLLYADFSADYNSRFGATVLVELAKYMTAATDGFLYDACSCTIQEVLNFFNCAQDKDTTQTSAGLLWTILPPQVQTLISPLLTTSYRFRARKHATIDQRPIFGTAFGCNMKIWLQSWISVLVKTIKNETAGRFYKTVAVMTEYEVGFAHFLLPHVLFQKVIENDFDEILNEVLKVLHSFSENSNLEKSFCIAACQVVFSSTDFLRKWANRARAWPEKDIERGYVMNFLNSIPKNLLAECAMLCNAYTRSLMYYEMHLDSSGTNVNIEEHMPFLQKLYAYLEDVDAVKGSLTFRIAHGKPTLHEYILTYESIGNYHDALPYHEAVTDAYPDDLSNHIAFVQCMLKLNQVTVSLRYIDGLRSENKQWSERLHLCRAETLRRLQSWDLLKQEMDEVKMFIFYDNLGRLMLCVKERKCDSFQAEVSAVRSRIMDEISVAMMDFASYDRIYGSVLKLHQLYEVEQFLEQVGRAGEEDPNTVLTNLGHCWDSRLKLLQHSSNVRHPVLELRRQLLDFWPRCDETIEMIGSSWLRSAKVARKAGHLQSAWSYLAKVKGKNFDAVFVEEAKLLWLKNEQGEALSCLENGISSRFSKLFISPNQAEADEHKPLFAKAQLLLANYARDSSSRDAFEVLDLYKKLLSTCPDNEQGYYNTAVHLDQIAQTHSYRHSYHIVLPKMVSSYGKSLKYGLKNLHHSMPRLLTLWLDSTARLHEKQTKNKGDRESADIGLSEDSGQKMELLNSLNKIVRQLSDELPVQLFYSCFSQLISRVCHPADSTAEILKTIIAKVIATFPQQGLWMSLSVATSTNPQRRQACKEVYEKAMALNARVKPLLDDMTEFLELLKKLCYSAAGARRLSLSMSQDFPKLNSYFSNRRVSRTPIILPMQSMMDINMSVLKLSNSACSDQKPIATSFPIQPVYIAGFADTVEILSSLQKPKKILIVCTDGKTYPMMCKAKDDLRLDKRLMEFNNLVNTCLLRNAESRKRQLRIRTYTVIPLSHDCGLVEWVNNLEGLRQILGKLYKELGGQMHSRELQSTMARKTDSLGKKLEIFETVLLKRHPPVLSRWFGYRFADPTEWYQARTNFVRTAAVMSMVGYVLGLGDRHGENILIDSTSGDVVHVDFNCLFNKGEDLEWPELVPFRLTHNMVDAMGPLGCEGAFRKCCELTMQVMRERRGMLRSVLETFLHDPLVEWTRNSNKPRPTAGEDKAREHLQNIETRLKGSVKASLDSAYGLPLSVEGQVAHLIRQAMDKKLLCQMYIGWAAFM